MMVSIIGAGPGAPDLITVRGLQRIQSADVLIHDRLVSPQLIAQAPVTAKRINVGKAPNKRRFPQKRINEIIVEEARAGHRVVRLKGGDPFVFGLGSSEALALVHAQICFEIIPGLSSAIALSALSGAALTVQREVTSFSVLSGHHPPDHPEASDFDNLPRNGTLVILMGRRHLNSIVARLFRNGWNADTPALIIASGTTIKQDIRSTSLGGLVQTSMELNPPITLVIGNGAALREKIAPWLIHSTQNDGNEESWGIAREPDS
jgi:uroporphyrin-III C-methyltransferase